MRRWADEWACKLQQYTGAIMAKSMEDTFFYRYVRLFGANEVGHHPAEFGLPVESFHEENAQRLQAFPACMLSTSTHDTKLSEDARARLLALSELPDRWGRLLREWSEANREFKSTVGDKIAPDANEEYLLYQILLAAWPLREKELDDVFRDRIRNYMRKALSESKANTNWAVPNEPWMKAACDFADALLDRKRAGAFWKTFVPFADELARRGALVGALAGRAEAHVTGGSRYLSGLRDVGPQPGRSRQPAPGRLRASAGIAARARASRRAGAGGKLA